MALSRRWLVAIAPLALVGAGYLYWNHQTGDALPEGIAGGNGRIEAVEIDISTKTPGRIEQILVSDGDFVQVDQVLAKMDTEQLQAQQRQAQAQWRRAVISVEAARSIVIQRQAERRSAAAVVAQRQAQFDTAAKKLSRSEQPVSFTAVSQQVLDENRVAAASARSALAAAEAQLTVADAAIGAANVQVVEAEAAVGAARAVIESVTADINDGTLRSPRDGRIQYRIAQPGEVLSAGGHVLDLVDLEDVHMKFFLPTAQAGRVAIGDEVRLVLDAAPQYVIPAKVTFVADVAQSTPLTAATRKGRRKLMVRVKAAISPDLLRRHIRQFETGLSGTAYVRLDPQVEWPANLRENLLR